MREDNPKQHNIPSIEEPDNKKKESFPYKHNCLAHEKFPLRYGWLYKIVKDKPYKEKEDNIIQYGVGSNMVDSMKIWAGAFGIWYEKTGVTPLGKMIFGKNGLDRYSERDGTLWILHWNLVSNELENSTWWWAFNKFSDLSFTKKSMQLSLTKFIEEKKGKLPAESTLKGEIDCLFKTYAPSSSERKGPIENTLESPLSELGLIKLKSGSIEYKFEKINRKHVPRLIFYWALAEYCEKINQNIISLEKITYDSGSPGRIFKLDEAKVVSYLSNIGDFTKDFSWSETNIPQVIKENQDIQAISFLEEYYKNES